MDYTFRPIINWPRAKNRRPKGSAFRVKYQETLELLEKELKFIGAKNIVIQVDLPESKIRHDGLPRSSARPDFQGVIISFDSKFGPLQYLTDTFDDWQDNLRAIALGLEALRKVDRYGITSKGEQYTGWKALPAGTDAIIDVHGAAEFISKHSGYKPLDILTNEELCKRAYREAARILHPDKGGDPVMFNLLQKAKELLIK